jgi:hypothetical protein
VGVKGDRKKKSRNHYKGYPVSNAPGSLDQTHPLVLSTLDLLEHHPEVRTAIRTLPMEFYDQVRASAWLRVLCGEERVTSLQQAIKDGEQQLLLLLEDGYVPITVHVDQGVDISGPSLRYPARTDRPVGAAQRKLTVCAEAQLQGRVANVVKFGIEPLLAPFPDFHCIVRVIAIGDVDGAIRPVGERCPSISVRPASKEPRALLPWPPRWLGVAAFYLRRCPAVEPLLILENA